MNSKILPVLLTVGLLVMAGCMTGPTVDKPEPETTAQPQTTQNVQAQADNPETITECNAEPVATPACPNDNTNTDTQNATEVTIYSDTTETQQSPTETVTQTQTQCDCPDETQTEQTQTEQPQTETQTQTQTETQQSPTESQTQTDTETPSDDTETPPTDDGQDTPTDDGSDEQQQNQQDEQTDTQDQQSDNQQSDEQNKQDDGQDNQQDTQQSDEQQNDQTQDDSSDNQQSDEQQNQDEQNKQDEQDQQDDGQQQDQDEKQNNNNTTEAPSGYAIKIIFDGEWTGAIATSEGTTRTITGSGTTIIDVEGSPSIVSANAQKRLDNSKTLTIQILMDGEVVQEASTSAAYGIAQVTAGPGDGTSSNETTKSPYSIRISYEGQWSGTIGQQGRMRTVDGSGTETFTIEGEPSIIVANAQKRDGGSGTLTISILKNGEVIAQKSTDAQFGMVQVSVST